MYYRQIYILTIILSLLITSCQELPTDPGDSVSIQTTDGVNHWGGEYNDFGHHVYETADGGYAVVGSQYSVGTQEDLALVKFNSSLVAEDQYIYSAAGDDSVYNNNANDVQQTLDGGYVTVGNTFNGSNYDVLIVKFSPQLTVTWWDTIGGAFNDFGNSIQETSDGGFLVCGTKYDGNDEDVMLWKVTVADNTPSYTILYNPESATDNGTREYGIYAEQTSDGGYIVAATVPTGIQVTKLAADGTADTGFNTDGSPLTITGCDNIEKVKQLVDGSYIVLGNVEEANKQSQIYINTITSAGVAGTAETWGGVRADKASSIVQTLDGGFVITGSQYSDATADDIWIVKFDDSLNPSWERTYGGDLNDNGSSIMQTDDGGYIVTGSSMSYGNQSQIILLKVDALGCVYDDEGKLLNCGLGS
tara:strand:+ start:888 stop:2141 length:1254 start_codon:yes stop_codon:yes gene_type:complete